MAASLEISKGGKKRARPQMNVTPLVDVVLVLLIIFMVITPLLAKQFWVHVPDRNEQSAAEPDNSEGPIVLSVDAQSTIRINRQVVDEQQLARTLRGFLAARGTRQVFFDASDRAPFGRAMRALDLARGAGATQIAVSPESLGVDP